MMPDSKKPLHVWGLVPNHDAVPRVRLIGPLEHLAAAHLATFRLLLADEAADAVRADETLPDLVVLCRIIEPPSVVALVTHLQQKGVPVIYEIDDQLLDLPPSNPGYATHQDPVRRKTLIQLLHASNAITVTTAALRDALRQYNPTIYVLPNCVDLTVFDAPIRPQSETPVVIGYGGTRTHSEDFAVVVPAIRRIAADFAGRAIFRFLNFIPDELQGVSGVEFVDGHPDYRQFAKIMQASGWHFALAPLADNSFNRCKSEMKFIEYGALGIPAIYSAVHPYLDHVRDGVTGRLVMSHTSEAWYEAIAWLITHPAERQAMARAAYQTVIQTRSLRDNSASWNAAYRHVIAEWTTAHVRSVSTVGRRPEPRFSLVSTPWYHWLGRVWRIFWYQGPAMLLRALRELWSW